MNSVLLQEPLEKEVIFESLSEGVLVVDPELKILDSNSAMSKMFSIPKKLLIGKLLTAFGDNPLIERCSNLLATCQQSAIPMTASFSTSNEKKQYYDLICTPMKNRPGAVLVLQDKSSHYKVLEMGKAFVSNASHELRTPITIIKGFAETLQEMPQLPEEMFDEIIHKIIRNCERMEKLIHNLLTLADIENLPESRFKSCDIVDLAEHCRTILLTLYPEVKVEIRTGKPQILISAYSDLLELAIMNLLQNAVKYSESPAVISIEIDPMEEQVKLTIADRGIGIPSADVEHIFERFYTVNKAHSRRLGGAGLGLSIVRTIIEKHEGSVTVSSELGRGTTFTIILPFQRSGK